MIKHLGPISNKIDIYVCEDEQIKKNSTEDKMICFFNKVAIDNLLNEIPDIKLRLTTNQIKKLNENKTIDRF
jgi:hypothetical protein